MSFLKHSLDNIKVWINKKIAMMKKEKLPEKVNEELIKMYWKVGEFLSKETEHAS